MVKISEDYPVTDAHREIHYFSNRYGVEIVDWSNCEDNTVRDEHIQNPYDIITFRWKIVHLGDDPIRYDTNPTMRYSKLEDIFNVIVPIKTY